MGFTPARTPAARPSGTLSTPKTKPATASDRRLLRSKNEDVPDLSALKSVFPPQWSVPHRENTDCPDTFQRTGHARGPVDSIDSRRFGWVVCS